MNRSARRAARPKPTGWPLDAPGNGRARGMIAARFEATPTEHRTRLTGTCDREAPATLSGAGALRFSAGDPCRLLGCEHEGNCERGPFRGRKLPALDVVLHATG